MQLKSLLKTKALIIITLLTSFSAFAQAPNLLNYQGVARNAVGNPLPNQTMKLRLSIHDLLPSGAVVYSEIRQITTNLGGLFSVQIGSAGASSSTGTLGGVNWIVGNKFLQVELDPASNNNYMDIGTVQLVSVPYAFGAGSAATVKTNANLTGVVTSVGNQTSIANGAITSDMIGTLNKSKVGLDLVNNTSDAAKPISTATQGALDSKLAIADSTTGYVTPAQLATKTFDQTPITNAIAGKLAIADSTNGYVTPRQLAAKTFDTTSLSNRISEKASTTAVNNALALKAPLASPTFTGTVTTSGINTGALSSTSITAPTFASAPKQLTYSGSTINWNPAQGLNAFITLTANSTLSFTAAPPVGSYGTVVLTQDGTGTRTITLPTLNGVSNKVLGSTSTSTVALSTAANSKDILNFYFDGSICYWNIGQGYGAASSGSSNSGNTNLASGVTGILPVANGGTGAATLTGLVKGNGTSALTAAVAGTDYQAPITLTTTGTGAATLSGTTLNIPAVSSTVTAGSLTGTVAIANGGTDATTAAAALTNLGAAPIASPTFTGTVTTGIINTGALSATSINTGSITATTITAPIYASTPQTLADAATIAWNPALGLNASVILGGNRTLSFSSTPAAGAYGTLVVTQDATGGRTLNLPSTTNKVLGSATTTSVALSSAPNAKDILNFYYDGTNCYWNVGQGYGTAASAPITLTTTGTGAATLSGTTLNIPAVSSTVTAGSLSGTVAVANGGTGATTLTGYIKGSGTSTMTASATIPVADVTGAAPLASPTFSGTVTTGIINTGALSATSVTTPIYASTPQALTDAATISWNPALGLNASVTLGGDRTLSFSTTPVAGAYGTLVVTQDGTGGRKLTLPSTTNKVLGSATSSSISLSAAPNTKDIVNFYFDGTNCYWNVGQGFGTAASAPITLTTTGTGAATLSGTTLNIPSVSSTVNAGSISGTVAVANGGTGVTTSTGTGNVVLSASPTFSGSPVLPTGTTGVTQAAGNNSTALATTAFVTNAVKITTGLNSEEVTATASHTGATATFTLTQTPLNNKVFMFINGTRIKNGAYSVSGTTVTYTVANNNSYTLVANDRIQFDYAY